MAVYSSSTPLLSCIHTYSLQEIVLGFRDPRNWLTENVDLNKLDLRGTKAKLKGGHIGAVTNPLTVNHQPFQSFGFLGFRRGVNGRPPTGRNI